ncbi:hypothetical protein A3N49_12355 [Enterobacter hormaechei subsp. steigerwaltii]|nr:hypothetical protein A3N49_12355 [Enterobacter hormaechei subsp. steigerwaltii]
MFQDNPLLAQLKQQLHSQTPRAEGVVKATEKGFGFLEVDGQKSYFIPPPQMKKVMHGDRISAVIHTEKERESAEPEALIEPFLTRFVGKVHKKDDRLSVVPDHPLLKDAIPCRAARGVEHDFVEGDWAVAEMRRHPLKGDRGFYAELTQYITFGIQRIVHILGAGAVNGDKVQRRQIATFQTFVLHFSRHALRRFFFEVVARQRHPPWDEMVVAEGNVLSKLGVKTAIAF